LGDDSTGAYESMKRGNTASSLQYAVWKGICNSYWIAILVLILTALLSAWKKYLSQNPEVSALMLSILYLYSMHSVFESGGKYHIPLIAFFSILAALVVAKHEDVNLVNFKTSA
jgi:hypothetical protein